MKINYSELSEVKLHEKLKELEKRKFLASNNKAVQPKEPVKNFTKIKKEIARIKTELKKRK